MKCIKCDWQGSVNDCHYFRGYGLTCPECGGAIEQADELTAPPLIESRVDMAAVERLENLMEGRA